VFHKIDSQQLQTTIDALSQLTLDNAPFSLIKCMRYASKFLRSFIWLVSSGLGVTMSESDSRTDRLRSSAPFIRSSSSTSGGRLKRKGFCAFDCQNTGGHDEHK
jgi:hypothetical protein